MNQEENNNQDKEQLGNSDKTAVSESFYCQVFTEDEFSTNDDKCKKQCYICKNVC